MSSIPQENKVRKLQARRAKKALAFAPDRIWVDRSVTDHPQTIRMLNKLPDAEVDVVDDVKFLKRPSDVTAAKQQMILTAHKGEAFKTCQGMSPSHLCCGYRVIDLVSGCPMDCSYCILQSYLSDNPRTTVYVNIEQILAEVSEFLSKHSTRFFRIGTGELSDSLALDAITEHASILIPYFASKRNAILELKTKAATVDHLLDLRHRNRTVISWSVNLPSIIASDERGTATLDERLAAAQRVAAAGFGVGFHFDPIIITRDFDAEVHEYTKVMDEIFQHVEPRQISWMSLGMLRYPRELARIATKRFPETHIFAGEVIPAGNRMRYLRFAREKAYRMLWDYLRQKLPPHKIYLCMETAEVWEKIDPSIRCSANIEKRLGNTENIAFDYKV